MPERALLIMVNNSQLLLVTKVCSHLAKTMDGGLMRGVTVRLNAAEFSAGMTTIGEWLNANRYEPTRYKYDHQEDAVLVTVDFTTEVAAAAFAMRFDGAYHSSTQTASSDSVRELPT